MIKQIILIILLANIVLAQWSTTAFNPLRVSDWGMSISACSDNNGGAYIGWRNFSYEFSRAYLQHVDKYGNISWAEPLEIVDQGIRQMAPYLIADGNGNCIATVWASDTIIYIHPNPPTFEFKPYHQKIDASGNRLWDTSGVRSSKTCIEYSINDGSEKDFNQMMRALPDGDGGVILNWDEWNYLDTTFTIRLQKITNSGKLVMGESGKILHIIKDMYGKNPLMVADGNGGIIHLYGTKSAMYFERLNEMGNNLWTTQTPSADYTTLGSLSGKGAVVIGEENNLNGEYLTINIIDEHGNLLYAEDKNFADSMKDIGVSNIVYNKETELIFWAYYYNEENILKSNYQIMRLNGELFFENGGKRISDIHPTDSKYCNIILQSNNDILAHYGDSFDSLTYVQKLDTLGNKLWDSTGVLIDVPYYQYFFPDMTGGGILVHQVSPYYGAIAQQVSVNGNLGEVTVSVENGEMDNIPANFELYQNYPNPFNPSTIIKYAIPDSRYELHVRLVVYNVLGQEVTVLVNKEKKPGSYEVTFRADNLPSGVYLYKLEVGRLSISKKMILLR